MNALILAAVTIGKVKIPGTCAGLLRNLANMIMDIAGPGLARDVKKALLGSWKDNDAFIDSIYAFANQVFDVVKYVGCFLLMVHFLCDIMEKVTNEQFTLESFFKSFVKFFIGFAIILNCLTLFKTLTNFGMVITDSIDKGLQTIKQDTHDPFIYEGTDDKGNQITCTYTEEDIKNFSEEEQDKFQQIYQKNFSELLVERLAEDIALKDYPSNIFKKIATALGNLSVTILGPVRIIITQCKILLPWLFAKITYFVCVIIAFTRCVELLVRSALAPMAITDIYSQGTHGNGFRYIKKYFAVALQGAIIILLVSAMGYASGLDYTSAEGINKLVDCVAGSAGTSTTGAMYQSIFFRLAGTGLILKSQSLASEIVGA